MAKEVNIIVRGVRRAEPDLKRLARALLQQVLDEERQRKSEAESINPNDTGTSGLEAAS